MYPTKILQIVLHWLVILRWATTGPRSLLFKNNCTRVTISKLCNLNPKNNVSLRLHEDTIMLKLKNCEREKRGSILKVAIIFKSTFNARVHI